MEDNKQLDRLETKLMAIDEHLSRIDLTLAEQHLSLRTHMRRTAALEKEISPISKHIQRVQGAAALIGLMAAVAGILEFIRLLEHK